MHSCCCLTGLGLGLNILVLFPSLSANDCCSAYY